MNDPVIPWYRSFWAWFVIALLSAAVAGSLVSAYLAVTRPDVVLEHSDQAN
jgi:hypothetical protein